MGTELDPNTVAEPVAEPLEVTEPNPSEPIQEPAPEAPPTTEGQPENFLDPAKLPQELQPIWKKMQATYTKKMQGIKEYKQKAEIIDRFNTDPQFAQNLLQQTAQQMGFTLTRAEARAIAQAQPKDLDVPDEIVASIESKLPQELKWMAGTLASATLSGLKAASAPREQQEAQDRQRETEARYDEMAEQLATKAPGWEEHEDDMNDMLNFLQSGELQHKRFGSKLELLYNLVNNNGLATRQAITRMQGAARNRISTSQNTTGTVTSNYLDKMMKAPTKQTAFQIATEHALEELAQQGRSIK